MERRRGEEGGGGRRGEEGGGGRREKAGGKKWESRGRRVFVAPQPQAALLRMTPKEEKRPKKWCGDALPCPRLGGCGNMIFPQMNLQGHWVRF